MINLTKIIACPVCLQGVFEKNTKYVCSECNRVYDILEKIPVFLKAELKEEGFESREIVWKRKEMKEFEKHEAYQELMNRPYFQYLKEEISEELDGLKQDKKDILEVGSGISVFADKFADKNLVLTDINFSLLKSNKREIPKVAADAEYLPFKDKSFEFIYSVGLVHHLPNQRRGFKEMKRLCRPGGVIFLSEPTKQSVNLLYYVLRRLFMVFFGEKILRKMTGCGTPYESFINMKELKKVFKHDFEISRRKILPFRLPPLAFLERMKWPIALNRFLEKIPLIKKFGTIVFVTLKRKKNYGV